MTARLTTLNTPSRPRTGSRRPDWKVACLGLSLLFATAAGLAAPDGGKDGTRGIERFEWLGTLNSGQNIQVDNPYGDVRLRFGGYEHQVEVLAALQHLSPGAPRLLVQVDPDGAVLLVTVRYNDSEGGTDDGRADLVIFVPEGAGLSVRTRDGLIEAKGLKGDQQLTTVTGNLRVKPSEGVVKASTERGAINATFDPGKATGTHELTSVTGDISVYLSEHAHMLVEAETSGEISTDFSLEIEHFPLKEPGKRALARIGKGRQELHVRSKRGRIRLLRLQKDFPRATQEQEQD